MKRIFVYFLMALASLVATSTIAQAQATRTWVSGVGDDANPCSRTAPCKTFAGAISKTAAGGEIDALDPAGFGAVTIVKAITLDGGGGQVASILVAGTNGVIINDTSATAATDTITIRNLSFNGLGPGNTPGLAGVSYLSGGHVVIENCNFMGFTNGVNAALSTSGDVVIRNTSISNTSQTGINLATTSGKLHGSFSNVSIREMTTGVNAASAQVAIDISNSVIVGATGIGLYASTGSISAENNMISKNGTGAQADAVGLLRLSNNDFFDNTVGLGCGTGGVIASAGNNRNSKPTGGGACPPNSTLALQ